MSALTYVTADAPFTDSGNTAWVLAAAALVLFMTPGLALFYGGMVRTKSVLNMMMMSFITMGTVGTVWILWGYSQTFGPDIGGGLMGNPFTHFGLSGVIDQIYGYVPADAAAGTAAAGGIPATAFVAFQVVFAIIAVALVSGAIADRAKFSTWTIFTVVWATLVYFPAAHWVFAFSGYAAETGGWIANKADGLFLGGAGAYDFAGGTAIHINAGAAGLALALVLGKRVGFKRDPMRPHNLTLVMIGAGILWFGWFGFNAGSALGAGVQAAGVWVNTLAATATAMLGWLVTEKLRDGHATSLGAASGVVAGLDVNEGLFYGGGGSQLVAQLEGALVVMVFSFVVTYLIGLALHKTIGFRVSPEEEVSGIDLAQHAETGYDFGSFGGSRTGVVAGHTATAPAPSADKAPKEEASA